MGFFLRHCGGAGSVVLWGWVRGGGSAMRPRQWWSLRPSLSQSARRLPEPAGNLDRVDAGLPPPRTLVAGAVHRAMMPAAEWDRELIADLTAERARLSKSEVVGVRGLAAAEQTRLLGDIAQVLPVAIATRGRDCEDALIDALRLTSVSAFGGGNHLRGNLRHRRIIVRGCS